MVKTKYDKVVNANNNKTSSMNNTVNKNDNSSTNSTMNKNENSSTNSTGKKNKNYSANANRKIKWAQAIIIIFVLAAILLPQLIGTTTTYDRGQEDSVKLHNVYELDGVRQGVVTGSIYEDMVSELYPDSEITYLKEWADLPMSLSQGKIDSFIFEKSSIPEILAEYDDLMQLPGEICEIEYCYSFSGSDRGNEILDRFNEYITLIKADGTLDDMLEYWTTNGTDGLTLEPCHSDGTAGKILVSTCLDWPPYTYLGEDGPCGLCMDVVYRFCEWAGYEPEITSLDFQTALGGLSVGKFDFFAYGTYATEERSENVNFSAGFIPDSIYAVIRKSSYISPVTDRNIEDLNQPGVTVGVLAQTEMDYSLRTKYPDVDAMSYINLPDVYEACASGKVDYAIAYQDTMPYMKDEYPDLAYFADVFEVYDYGIAFQKNEKGAKLCSEYNEYVAELKENGTYAAYEEKWLTGNADSKELEERNITGVNGKIKVTTAGDWIGYSLYLGDNNVKGILAELMQGFCESYGYEPVYSCNPQGSAIAGVAQGTYDIMMDSVAITGENEDNVIISDIFLTSPAVIITSHISEAQAATEVSRAVSFWESIKKSFDKNFIREDRWKMILSGLKVTVFMSIASTIIGTLLGALICLLRMSRNPFLTGFARIYIKVMQGMPIVVLLMILYYLVFGQVDIGAFWVSVVGFSLDFAAYTSEIFRSGIESVPSGQQRAALALGFGPGRAFRKVVLPQAMRSILPVYRGQFISMVKLTSVAGYISVEDLTKVSDMIRARTFEAFFPLITTAIIYFLIAALLVTILKLVEVKTDPLIRNRKPRGIRLQEDETTVTDKHEPSMKMGEENSVTDKHESSANVKEEIGTIEITANYNEEV